MQSITFLDNSYPVKTFVSDKEDWQSHSDWLDASFRRNIIQAYLRTPLKQVLYAHETHSGSVFVISEETGGSFAAVDESFVLGSTGGFDAMITMNPGILLCVWTADCIPLFLYDTAKHAAGIVHCGWRGICSGIVENTIEGMRRCFGTDPRQIAAAFGPGICGNCYEVGSEISDFFAQRFPAHEREILFRSLGGGKYLLDLRQAMIIELLKVGSELSNICDSGICSFESEVYASYRRDGRSIPSRQTLSGIVLL